MPMHKLFRFAREFIADVRRDKYDRTPGGSIMLKGGVLLTGTYNEGIIGRLETWRRHENLIPTEGILKILGLAFFTDTRITAYYLAPFGTNLAPAATLTALTFPAAQGEITSGSEGYTQSTRQLWVPAAPAVVSSVPTITNAASLAALTIITATQLTIRGCALVSASAKGSTAGVLASCVLYSTARVSNNADPLGIGYEVSLTDS